MIRKHEKANCPLCASKGNSLYSGMKDRLFGAPDVWALSKCTNKNCKSIWLNPAPILEDIPITYETYYTHQDVVTSNTSLLKKIYDSAKISYINKKFGYKFEESMLSQSLSYCLYLIPRRIAEIEFEAFHLPMKENGDLLEVGCGSGSKLQIMKTFGWNAKGVDFDPKAIENAKSKGLDVKVGSLFDMKYHSNSFDAVVLSHVIEHVTDPRDLIRECFRILKPNGRLVVITPNTSSLGHFLFRSNLMHLDPPRHLTLFNPRNISDMAINCGYFNVKCATSIRDADGVFATSIQIALNGKGNMGPHKGFLGAIAKFAQLIEWLLMRLMPGIGEELVLTAQKPN